MSFEMYSVIIFCVFPIVFVSGESCISPNKLNGTCKSIKNCDVLSKIMTKANRTSLDEQFLRQSHCGFEGNLPKVCCPDSAKIPCVTSQGNAGECVGIQSCPYLVKLSTDTNTENVEYITNSACAGPNDHSVCCGPPADPLSRPAKEDHCEKMLSSFPPDPEGNCCGIDESVEDKIIRGSITYVTQYPWLVVIEYIKAMEKPKLLCGGALISGKYVLTAAHCVTGSILREGMPKNVRLGEFNVTNDGPDCENSNTDDCTDGMILAPIEEVIPHPEYDGHVVEKNNDIALIRMKIYAPYTYYIRPICLPKVDYIQSPPADFVLHIAGWGRYIQNITDRSNLFRNSDVKRHVKLPYVPRDKCEAAIGTLSGVEEISFSERQFCAGGDLGLGSCKGDSGGPLVFGQMSNHSKKYDAIGILSTGAVICGQEGIPSVFTNVYKYIPWIKANIKP